MAPRDHWFWKHAHDGKGEYDYPRAFILVYLTLLVVFGTGYAGFMGLSWLITQ